MANPWKRRSLDALVEEADKGMRGQGPFAELNRRTAKNTTYLTFAILFLTAVIAVLTATMVFPELANWFRGLFGMPSLNP